MANCVWCQWCPRASIASAGWPYEVDWPLATGRHVLEAAAAGSRSDPVPFEVR